MILCKIFRIIKTEQTDKLAIHELKEVIKMNERIEHQRKDRNK